LWQESNPSKWAQAIAIDNRLKALPEYKDMPLKQRFEIVIEKVKLIE